MDTVAPEPARRDPGTIGDRRSAFRALPDESPLEMPVQSLWAWRAPSATRPAPLHMTARRAFLIGGTAAATLFAAGQMHRVLAVAGLTGLEAVVLVLFVALFAWIVFSFISALAGFVCLLRGGRSPLGIDPAGPLPEVAERTALLMPTYNETPERVTAGLQAVAESVAATGRGDRSDIFILSDTTDPDVWVAEEAAYLALRERIGDRIGLFYRRRPKNTERKAGNIGDWVRRWGGAYAHFIILDADSLMTGDTVVRLAAAMEDNPDAGLIQTLPVIVNGRTMFARAQQFAGRLYGPLIAHGLAWWHGSEGNYWGHNAVIRTRAFAQEAGLPHLKGPKPFGGHILSHDFVEAALIRRGGWTVHMAPALGGSYEEGPPSLTDVAVRDRRWCQGNLQHAAVLPARGLHWVSRLHLLTGIGSYIASPLWLALLAVGLVASLQAAFVRPEYFGSELTLFPNWPAQDPVRARWVFIATMAVLLAPKLLAWTALLLDRRMRRGCGVVRSFLGVLVETVVSGLLAPVMMLIQSVGVGEIVLGRDAGWKPQRRDDGTVPFRDLVWRYGGHTLGGLVIGLAAYLVSPSLFLWMSPVVLGLVLAIPLAGATADPRLGLFFRRLGLFLIPEERDPPAILARANELVRNRGAAPTETEAVRMLAADPALLAAHRAMLPPHDPRPRRIAPDRVLGLAKLDLADTLPEALDALTPREKAAVLADPHGLDRLLALHHAGQDRARLLPAAE